MEGSEEDPRPPEDNEILSGGLVSYRLFVEVPSFRVMGDSRGSESRHDEMYSLLMFPFPLIISSYLPLKGPGWNKDL